VEVEGLVGCAVVVDFVDVVGIALRVVLLGGWQMICWLSTLEPVYIGVVIYT
jgi:hypothetical protein